MSPFESTLSGITSPSSQTRIKVSQNTAILIEAARSSGMSDEELISHAKAGNLAAFSQIAEGELEFSNLLDYAAEQPEDLEQAVRQGYQITFNTINGMKYYIGLTFDKLRDRDYPNLPDRIEGLTLSGEEIAKLRASLSPFWTFTETASDEQQGTVTVSITLPQAAS